jgi:hypothetical protein
MLASAAVLAQGRSQSGVAVYGSKRGSRPMLMRLPGFTRSGLSGYLGGNAVAQARVSGTGKI